VFSIFQNGIFLAILAHAVIGLSLIWDKILLENPETRDIVNYVFWLGAMSILGLLLIPFGFHLPTWHVAWLAFSAGALQLAASYFYYDALSLGEASQALAIMGGFTPLFTYLVAIPLLREPLGGASVAGFALLVAGGFVMFSSEKMNVRVILPLIVFAAATFALSAVLQKMAFDETNFVSAYVVFTIGTFSGALFFLIRGKWREEIFRTSEQASPRSKELYFINRFFNGVGSFLIFYAISRTSPAVVSAVTGLRYAIVFVGVYYITRFHSEWLHEEYRGWALIAKTLGTLLIIVGLIFVSLGGTLAA
jgi:drug/metabolite transporter (DMT)-like permease